jgi:hypothetical protein
MIRIGWVVVVLWLAQAVTFGVHYGCYPESARCPR